MKERAAIALGLALTLLGLFVFAVGWEEVFGFAREASLPIYGVAFVASLFTLVSRSYVWYRVLGVVDKPRPYWLVGSVFLTAMFAKYVTPYGQVTSGVGIAAIVSRYYESTYEESLAAIVSADFLNYVPYYSFGTVGVVYLVFVESPSVDVVGYALRGGVIIGVLMILLVLAGLWRTQLNTWLTAILVRLQRLVRVVSPARAKAFERENVRRRLAGFYHTFELLSRDRRTMILAAVFGHVAWVGLAGALYFSALAIGVDLPIGLVFLAVALSKLGFLMPTPGGVGGVEIAMASVLYVISPMGMSLATATAILYRVSTYWCTVGIGGLTSIALTVKDPLPP